MPERPRTQDPTPSDWRDILNEPAQQALVDYRLLHAAHPSPLCHPNRWKTYTADEQYPQNR
ncbi:MAG: hypothetical protein CMH63_00160 [Nanoarchaeota archaeon]|jgi:hypothetical protein|nr:hypothetical protein [Nanoarchaeota archaeon]|tara:strand:+ start:41871 stop:42053 length:183 start_codon:yes stop_codon:yes gene_type:complete